MQFSFADVARRLGMEPDTEAQGHVAMGLVRLAGARVIAWINSVPHQQMALFGFEIGNLHAVQEDDCDQCARFEWDEYLFAVLAMSQNVESPSSVVMGHR